MREEVVMGRKVKDVMTSEVICARPSTPYKQLVRLLTSRHVSGVPVVDAERRVVGVVSEADLFLKHAQPTGTFHRFPPASSRRRLEHRKAHGGIAVELMSWPVIAIGPQAEVAEAARRLHSHRIRRMPVIDPTGQLVGIVSHADLLKVFLRPDNDIRRDVLDQVIFGGLVPAPERVQVRVRDGVVLLEGACQRRSLIPVLGRAAAGVEGVVRVENRLGSHLDYSSSNPRPRGPTGSGLRTAIGLVDVKRRAPNRTATWIG
jgi:CBS-domain-containing membrane protein